MTISIEIYDRNVEKDKMVDNFIINYFNKENSIFYDRFNRFFMGDVNLQKEPIFPKEEKMVSLGNYRVFDFVFSAYTDLRIYLLRSAFKNNFMKDPLYNLIKEEKEVVRAYSGYKGSYENYINNLKTIAKNTYGDSFKDPMLEDYILYDLKLPYEISDYMLSIYKTGFENGLTIQVFENLNFLSLEQHDQFLKNEFFKLFIEGCRRFGFLLDRNIPYRMTCDLTSKATHYYIDRLKGSNFITMEEYLENYQEKNIDLIFSEYYNKNP